MIIFAWTKFHKARCELGMLLFKWRLTLYSLSEIYKYVYHLLIIYIYIFSILVFSVLYYAIYLFYYFSIPLKVPSWYYAPRGGDS